MKVNYDKSTFSECLKYIKVSPKGFPCHNKVLLLKRVEEA